VDVNKTKNDCEHAFTFRHVPYNNRANKRYVTPSYSVQYFNEIINDCRQKQPDFFYVLLTLHLVTILGKWSTW
jgi:hypothetical protein